MIISVHALLTALLLSLLNGAVSSYSPAHHGRHASSVSRSLPQNTALTSSGIWAPNYRNAILATSYLEGEYGGHLGGACGWNTGTSDRALPSVINGAAQKIGFFASGLARGTCVQLIPTDAAVRRKNPVPLTVTIVNSCPGECGSLDVEAGIVSQHYNGRLGQWKVQANVVPCHFLKHKVYIEYQQISNTIYDFRVSLRFQSGAFSAIRVRKSTSGEWLPMKQAETSQWTLQSQDKSPAVLGGGTSSTIDFEFTSYAGEKVYAWKVANPIARPKYWYDTSVNFAQS